MRLLGAILREFVPPTPYEAVREANGRLIAIEGWFHQGHLFGDPDLPMDEDVRPRFLSGRNATAAEYLRVLADREAMRAAYTEALRGVAAVLTPVTMTPAPPVAEIDQAVSPGHFTRGFNFLGMCALALPIALSTEGLPIGLQVAARGGDEAVALRVGAALELALPRLARPGL